MDGTESAIVVLWNATNKERVRERGKKGRRRAREEIGHLDLLRLVLAGEVVGEAGYTKELANNMRWTRILKLWTRVIVQIVTQLLVSTTMQLFKCLGKPSARDVLVDEMSSQCIQLARASSSPSNHNRDQPPLELSITIVTHATTRCQLIDSATSLVRLQACSYLTNPCRASSSCSS